MMALSSLVGRKNVLGLAAVMACAATVLAQAPIVRATPGSVPQPYGQTSGAARPQIATRKIVEGVTLRDADGAAVQTVSASDQGAELRVEHGVANVVVHHAVHDALLLVDLPGGQVSLVKDGLYTFNAETNTVRVLEGEAEALRQGAEPVRVKEDHQFTFLPGATRAKDANFAELRSDYLPGAGSPNGEVRQRPYGDGYYGYGYAPYGAWYPYPYYAYGPWGWSYPYGWYGYPYVGVGIGWGWGGGWGRGFRR